MSVDDCFIGLPAPLRRGVLRPSGFSPFAVLSELDLDETDAAADSGTASACGGVSRGGDGARSRTLKSYRPGPIPSRRAGASRGKTWTRSERRRHFLMKVCWDDSCLHLRTPSLSKENFPGQGSAEPSSALSLQELKDALPEAKQCHPPEAAVSRNPPRGRYQRSKAGWASKERSTPEGYNREEHALQFASPYAPGVGPNSIVHAYKAFRAPVVVRPPKEKKSPEERNAIRQKRIAQRERISLRHVETALCKYNGANNTKFELVEIIVKCMFFEFGGGCYHYNFTAKPEDLHSATGSSKLFFAEINYPLRSEDDVLVCCMVGEKDAGPCHACEDHRPTMVHPSRHVYGGGNTTAIDYPDEDSSSSDSDY